MTSTWYVTFDSRPSSLRVKRRRPRETRTFATEDEAKNFARLKLDDGLIVFAGTINPHLPRRHIASSQVHVWLSEGDEDSVAPSSDHD